MQIRIDLPSACLPSRASLRMTTEYALDDRGPVEDDLVGRVALDDVDVVEGRLVLLVGQVDLVGVVVDDHDRPRLGDDLAVDLADPLQPARRPVAEHQVVVHLEVRHVAPPQVAFDQERGHARREQARQPDPRDQQDHGQDPPDRRLGGVGIVQAAEQEDPDAPERFAEGLESPGSSAARPGRAPPRRSARSGSRPRSPGRPGSGSSWSAPPAGDGASSSASAVGRAGRRRRRRDRGIRLKTPEGLPC